MSIKSRAVKAAAVSLTAGAMLVGGLGFAGIASADGGAPGGPPPGQPSTQQARSGPGLPSPGAAAQAPANPNWVTTDLTAVAAKQIGITKDELLREMGPGRSIAQVAARHGITYADIKTTLVNAEDADLQKATAAGTVTQNDANQIVSTIPKLVEGLLARGSRPSGTGFARPAGVAPSGQGRSGQGPMRGMPAH